MEFIVHFVFWFAVFAVPFFAAVAYFVGKEEI